MNLCYHWLDANGHMVVEDGQKTSLFSYPGTRIPLVANVVAPLILGSYILILTLVQEGHFLFENKGSEFLPAKVKVVVTADSDGVGN